MIYYVFAILGMMVFEGKSPKPPLKRYVIEFDLKYLFYISLLFIRPMFPFYNSWNHQKVISLVIVSGEMRYLKWWEWFFSFMLNFFIVFTALLKSYVVFQLSKYTLNNEHSMLGTCFLLIFDPCVYLRMTLANALSFSWFYWNNKCY